MINYALHVYNTTGTKRAVITDFQSLSYIRRVNSPGAVWFTLAGDHSLLSNLEDKWRINVRRQRENGTWNSEIWALMRDEQWTHFSGGSKFSSYAQGIKSILAWRIVNWYTGFVDRSSFSSEKGETIMKTLVDYNAGSNATVANERKRDGVISGVTIESDSAGGNTIDWRCHGQNLLETLIELAIPAGGDFDLVPSSPTAYEFKFYLGQLGDDLSASILFSMANANMANPQYLINRSAEKTQASVWGQGEKESRDWVGVVGTNFHTDDNDIEVYVDARSIDFGDTDGLEAEGNSAMDELESRDNFSFEAIQSEGYKYKEDYDLGDLVNTENPFTETKKTMQIKSIAIKFRKNGRESIGIELEPR